MLRSRYYFTPYTRLRKIFAKNKKTRIFNPQRNNIFKGLTSCECLLYNLIYHIGWFSSSKLANQAIKRGHILVNKRIITYPNYYVKPNELIEIHPLHLLLYFYGFIDQQKVLLRRKLYPFSLYHENTGIFSIKLLYSDLNPYDTDFFIPLDNRRLTSFFRYER